MQLLEIFTVYDAKASAFITPFFLPTKEMATRTFTDCVNDPNHMFGKHPHDYSLFQLGTFQVSNGIIEALDPPSCVGNGLEFKTMAEHPTEEQLDFLAEEEQSEKKSNLEHLDRPINPQAPTQKKSYIRR